MGRDWHSRVPTLKKCTCEAYDDDLDDHERSCPRYLPKTCQTLVLGGSRQTTLDLLCLVQLMVIHWAAREPNFVSDWEAIISHTKELRGYFRASWNRSPWETAWNKRILLATDQELGSSAWWLSWSELGEAQSFEEMIQNDSDSENNDNHRKRRSRFFRLEKFKRDEKAEKVKTPTAKRMRRVCDTDGSVWRAFLQFHRDICIWRWELQIDSCKLGNKIRGDYCLPRRDHHNQPFVEKDMFYKTHVPKDHDFTQVRYESHADLVFPHGALVVVCPKSKTDKAEIGNMILDFVGTPILHGPMPVPVPFVFMLTELTGISFAECRLMAEYIQETDDVIVSADGDTFQCPHLPRILERSIKSGIRLHKYKNRCFCQMFEDVVHSCPFYKPLVREYQTFWKWTRTPLCEPRPKWFSILGEFLPWIDAAFVLSNAIHNYQIYWDPQVVRSIYGFVSQHKSLTTQSFVHPEAHLWVELMRDAAHYGLEVMFN